MWAADQVNMMLLLDYVMSHISGVIERVDGTVR